MHLLNASRPATAATVSRPKKSVQSTTTNDSQDSHGLVKRQAREGTPAREIYAGRQKIGEIRRQPDGHEARNADDRLIGILPTNAEAFAAILSESRL
jgi:hypothetical protein